jgi:hypothetical protein
MKVTIIRTNDTEETHTLKRGDLAAVRALIDCQRIDTVRIDSVYVMVVDDDGYEVEVIDHGVHPDPKQGGRPTHFIERKAMKAKKPVNKKATALYHIVRGNLEHNIVGDVAIVRDKDFGDDDE